MKVLEAKGVRKTYGGVVALRSCDFAVAPGTVHALLGENGAGKSTLVKILAGYVRPDSGSIALDGKRVRFTSTADAARHGVAVVSQELNLFPDLDVLANLFTKRERVRGVFFDRAAMAGQAVPVLAELGLAVPLRTPVGELTLAQRQLVEIAKALLTRPRVLILDEPTSALDDTGTQRLLGVLEVLRQRQVAVVFVSHILEEVMQLSDLVTVLRDGEVVMDAAPRQSLTIDDIVRAMLGDRLVAEEQAAESAHRRPTVGLHSPATRELTVTSVTVPGVLDRVSLTAGVGEIVGLAGVVGAGHQALLEVLSGQRAVSKGTVRLPGASHAGPPPRSLRSSVRRGVAVVSGDRRQGLMLDKPIWHNVAQVRSVALATDGHLLRPAVMRSRARARVAELGVRASSVDQLTGMLSGGNQQKVVLARWLATRPSVLLLDDPTKGIDIQTKEDLYTTMDELCSQGVCVLLHSSDDEELLGISDRVLVFNGGRIVAELTGDQRTRQALYQAAYTSARPAA